MLKPVNQIWLILRRTLPQATMNSSIRRRTRSQRQGQKFNVGGAWTEEKEIEIQTKEEVTVESTSNYESTGEESMSKSAIDQIRAELFEERYAPSVEPEYEDESHSWGTDNEAESEEYQHFLGRYE